MEFSVENSIEILERTPSVLNTMLQGIASEWTSDNEGKDTWSVYDVIGHLIHGEKTDWVPRAKIILSANSNKNFEVFDRFAQFENSKGKSLNELLDEFGKLRKQNLDWLYAAKITDDDLEKKGIHPAFDNVSLSQLLATWTVHDLNHIAQIARIMSKQYQSAVGPWTAYLKILQP